MHNSRNRLAKILNPLYSAGVDYHSRACVVRDATDPSLLSANRVFRASKSRFFCRVYEILRESNEASLVAEGS